MWVCVCVCVFVCFRFLVAATVAEVARLYQAEHHAVENGSAPAGSKPGRGAAAAGANGAKSANPKTSVSGDATTALGKAELSNSKLLSSARLPETIDDPRAHLTGAFQQQSRDLVSLIEADDQIYIQLKAPKQTLEAVLAEMLNIDPKVCQTSRCKAH